MLARGALNSVLIELEASGAPQSAGLFAQEGDPAHAGPEHAPPERAIVSRWALRALRG